MSDEHQTTTVKQVKTAFGKPTTKFPVIIQLGRSGQVAVWEVVIDDPNQRINALSSDATVLWFYAYQIRADGPPTLVKAKKTVVTYEEPDK